MNAAKRIALSGGLSALVLSGGLLLRPAIGQVVSPLNPGAVDTSAFPTKAQVDAAMAEAEAARTLAASAVQPSALDAAAANNLAIMRTFVPVPATSAPPTEVIGGTVGTAGTYRPADSASPRITRAVSGVTVAGGTALVTWTAMSSTPKLVVIPYVASNATQAPSCFPVTGTITTTGATIKCFTTQTATVAVPGAVIAPVTTAAAGVSFDVIAIPQS